MQIQEQSEIKAFQDKLFSEIGLKAQQLDDRVSYDRLLMAGVHGKVLKALVVKYGFRNHFITVFDVSSSNISRFYSRKHLPLLQSESVLDIVQIIRKAVQVFGSEEKALKWIDLEVSALGGKTPREACKTSRGRNDVMAALRKIETGEFV